jgi:rieske iron-sulfur protein
MADAIGRPPPALRSLAMNDSTQQTSLPRSPCTGRPASHSKRASLKTLAGAALVLGGSYHKGNAIAADDDAPRAGDWLVGVDDATAKPIGPADLKINEKQIIVFAYDPAEKRARSDTRLNRIILIKLDPASLDAETALRAADGVVAYSAICTHQTCDVNAWMPEQKFLLCGCHFAQYNPAEGASRVTGPQPRSLASLPLKIDGDKLVLDGGFSRRPGMG